MLLDLLQKRYSCRNFSDRPISSEIVAYMLECGRLSASGGNHQPWKFGVVTDAGMIGRIAEAASTNFRQPWIAKAPLVIVLCTERRQEKATVELKRFPSLDGALRQMDQDVYTAVYMEEHQTKIPGEHMVLAALEHGVYSTWISSMDCERVGALLGVQGYLVTNAIAFGYPESHRALTPKKSLRDITFTDQFQNPGWQG